jgi:hypothetical protein
MWRSGGGRSGFSFVGIAVTRDQRQALREPVQPDAAQRVSSSPPGTQSASTTVKRVICSTRARLVGPPDLRLDRGGDVAVERRRGCRRRRRSAARRGPAARRRQAGGRRLDGAHKT